MISRWRHDHVRQLALRRVIDLQRETGISGTDQVFLMAWQYDASDQGCNNGDTGDQRASAADGEHDPFSIGCFICFRWLNLIFYHGIFLHWIWQIT